MQSFAIIHSFFLSSSHMHTIRCTYPPFLSPLAVIRACTTSFPLALRSSPALVVKAAACCPLRPLLSLLSLICPLLVVVSDEDLSLVLTAGLSPSYENSIVTLDSTSPDELTLDYIITRLTNEEARQVHSQIASESDDGAMLSRARHCPRVPLESITCFKCQEKGYESVSFLS